ncbi:MAG TPA: hypothetical protein VMT17_06165 [Anaeromyxobacteraceae bacterium]|nr:hypothetical protein [Anaeromyxobacteraceae bacterium]
MNRFRVTFVALVLAVGAAARAQTPPPPAPDLAPRHKGFFLRMDGGFGYLGSSASQGGLSVSVNGFSSQFGVAVGAAIVENLILAGDFWGAIAWAPSVTVSGGTANGGSVSSNLIGIGPHVTYYFMPANVYVSVTPSVTWVSLSYADQTASTKAGFGMKFALGKEWWVGSHWGLGIAGQFMFSLNEDQGTNPPTWTSFAGGVSFSATLN